MVYFNGQKPDPFDAEPQMITDYAPHLTEYDKFFDDPNDYRAALDALSPRGGEAFYHELAHGTGALLAGVKSVRYGILFGPPEAPRAIPFTIYEPCVLPRIALASVITAPTNVSSGDMDYLRLTGYGTIEDVAERIERWNRHHAFNRLPMPGELEA